jgi:hypothetical protein
MKFSDGKRIFGLHTMCDSSIQLLLLPIGQCKSFV